MSMNWNPNILVAQMNAQPVVQMGQDLAEMERRRKRACKYGRTKAGTCRKRRR